jgi:hypothetical protein
MGVMTMNYGVLVSFCRKLSIFAKAVGKLLRILTKNLKILKTHQNSDIRPLCITDLEYKGMTKKYGVSVSFCFKLTIYGKTVG